MPFDLHQRLSEFSYGYGVTREIQALLESIGLRSTPFLPSLLHEAKIGCDVYFDRPGVALLIQFKLGQELKQFRRSDMSNPTPELDKPFWRFVVDTAEEYGQYDLLLKSEQAGAEVFYIAPRFSEWVHYANAFEKNEVLDNSLLIKPSDIETKLRANGESDGLHRIVYDQSRIYLCSTPTRMEEANLKSIALGIQSKISESDKSFAEHLKKILNNFGQRREIKRLPDDKIETQSWRPSRFALYDLRPARIMQYEQVGDGTNQIEEERARRIEELGSRAETKEDVMFATVGIETWATGSQLIAVTEN